RAAREHDDEVRPEALDLLGHARLRAGADSHHGDHRADADDDAEHGQGTPELFDPEGRAGDTAALPDAHAASSSSRGRDVSATAASTGSATRSSALSRPSRKIKWRLAYVAMSGSWVTRTIVSPARLSPCRRASTSTLVRVSRLPVGSSARIIAGSLTSARAIATRCCCPPESWLGWGAAGAGGPAGAQRRRH